MKTFRNWKFNGNKTPFVFLSSSTVSRTLRILYLLLFNVYRNKVSNMIKLVIFAYPFFNVMSRTIRLKRIWHCCRECMKTLNFIFPTLLTVRPITLLKAVRADVISSTKTYLTRKQSQENKPEFNKTILFERGKFFSSTFE